MRLSAISATLLIALFVVVVPTSARVPSYRVARCAPSRSHVIAANRQAVVYAGPEEEGVSGPESKGEIVIFGCSNARKVAYVLGVKGECDAAGCGGILRETLAGSVVAYEQIFSTGDSRGPGTETSRWLLVVRDLRSGRVLRRVATGTSTEPRQVGLGETSSLVMNNNGAIAWIVSKSGSECLTAPASECYEVHEADKNGTRIVASGTDIAPLSLALAGSTIYWTQGGKPASTTMN
jgi:hypothetical protein